MGTRQDVECLLKVEEEEEDGNTKKENESLVATPCLAEWLWEGAVLVSPFFFWGTAMVAMKEVLPKCGAIFVAAFRLIPAGFLLVGIALVDAACFQGFLTEGLQRTLAGLGSLCYLGSPLELLELSALYLVSLDLCYLSYLPYHLMKAISHYGEVVSGGCFLQLRAWQLALSWVGGLSSTLIFGQHLI